MKHKAYLVKGLLALVLLAIALGGGVAQGQGPAPQSSASVQAALGTAFTYQGRLTDGGVPADGTYDFRFKLWDSLSGGTQVGSTIDKEDVAVSNGLFTVQLDFGSSAFTGDARYLGIGVRPGDSPGQFTALTPRQELTPAPYALALPGLWTQQNVTSPNLIGGYSGNSVASGVDGATIGGGGRSGLWNRVTDDYGTVGGGVDNQAGDDAGTTDDADYATVGGGYENTASNDYATVGGGRHNTASGYYYATVGGGGYNTASGEWATVGGGYENTASGDAATVGGGYENTASGDAATVGGGSSNTASGDAAIVPGGFQNMAQGMYSFAGGRQAQASLYGQMAFASGQFAGVGDAQTSVFVLRNTTTSAAAEELFLDGLRQRVTITETRALAFDILVVAAADNGNAAAYHYSGGIRRDTGTNATLIGSVVELMAREDDANWNVTIDADTTNNALRILVTGAAGRTIRWVATVRTVETVMP